MQYGLYHITSATTTVLIPKNGTRGLVNSIRISNQHVSDVVTLDLYLDDDTNQSYFFKNLRLYPGTSVFLDENDDVSFDNSVLGLKLTTAGSGLPVSVIIR
tara:strand:- start:504 stop:806 length:303 start_codon:yes stop_codon:yes gene_type:complete